MPQKTVTVSISGLATQPNDLSGTPSGSCAIVDGMVFRRPGECEPAPKLGSLNLTFPATADNTILKSMADELDNNVSSVVVFSNYDGEAGPAPSGATVGCALQVQDADTGANEFYSSVMQRSDGGANRNLAFFPGRTNSTLSRDRRIFAGERAPVTWTRNTADTANELRLAGLQSPGGVIAVGSGSPPQADVVVAPAGKSAYYRALCFRRYPKYELKSAPTAAFWFSNGGGDLHAVTVTVNWDKLTSALQEGDELIVYRTQFFDAGVDPGDEFQECTRAAVSSANLTAGFASLHDLCPDNALGEKLYTNSLQEGPTQGNYPPPDSRCVATFNDTTFYVANTDTPTMELGINDFGSINAGATVGVYSTTNGNNVTSGDTVFQVAGDVTSTIVVGMAVSAGLPSLGGGLISSLSFSAGFTTIVLVAGAGLTGHLLFTAGAGTHAIFISDTVTFTYTLYNNTTDVRTFYYTHSNPYFLPFDLNDSSTHNTYGVNVVALSTARPSTPTDPSVVLALAAAQTGRIRSFVIGVTHGYAYTQMDTSVGVNFATKNSVQNTSTSRVAFSKTSLPEAVTPLSYFDVGHGDVLRILADNNNLYALSTDGLYRITGLGNDWTVTQISRTSLLVHPDAACVLNGQVFAWCTEGVCAVSANAATNISSNAIGPSLDPLAKTFVKNAGKYWTPTLAADALKKELWLFSSQPNESGLTYVFNVQTGNWCSRNTVSYTCGAYVPGLSTLYFPGLADFSDNQSAPELYFEDESHGWEDPVVRPNLFTAGAPGVLKQWIDYNLLVAREIEFFNGDSAQNIKIQFLFESDAATAQGVNFRVSTAQSLQREHCWVPRRAALQDTLKTGFVSLGVDANDNPQSVNFRLQGFAVRYRVASETFQR